MLRQAGTRRDPVRQGDRGRENPTPGCRLPSAASLALLAPGHVPDELGGSYEDACAALELPPVPGGYALYLLDQMNQRQTVISTDSTAVRQAELPDGDGGNGYLNNARVAAACIAEVRGGWPEEFGGGPRCQFCKAPDPAWVYVGADVEVLLGEPVLGFRGEPRPVIGSDVVGCIDWHACRACRDLIEAADLSAWRNLLGRYGDPDVPMPVQSAWREFWANHRPSKLAAPPEWTPGRRRRMAYEIAACWDAFIAAHPVDDIPFTDDTDVPGLAGADSALDAARAYLEHPPPAGRQDPRIPVSRRWGDRPRGRRRLEPGRPHRLGLVHAPRHRPQHPARHPLESLAIAPGRALGPRSWPLMAVCAYPD
jgi:hypothetical protein